MGCRHRVFFFFEQLQTQSALGPTDELSRPNKCGVMRPVTPAHVFFCSSSPGCPQLGSFSAVHSAARTAKKKLGSQDQRRGDDGERDRERAQSPYRSARRPARCDPLPPSHLLSSLRSHRENLLARRVPAHPAAASSAFFVVVSSRSVRFGVGSVAVYAGSPGGLTEWRGCLATISWPDRFCIS